MGSRGVYDDLLRSPDDPTWSQSYTQPKGIGSPWGSGESESPRYRSGSLPRTPRDVWVSRGTQGPCLTDHLFQGGEEFTDSKDVKSLS